MVAIENPWFCVLEELHVDDRASDGDVHLAGPKYHLISPAPVAYDVDETLETLSGVRCDIGFVRHAAPAHADVAPEGEAELGLVDGGEAGVDR